MTHCDGNSYSYDNYVKNGTIITVNPWYNSVTYSVNYDDNTIETVSELSITACVVIKTQKEREQEYTQFLQAEEQRLLQQLENVRKQMRK